MGRFHKKSLKRNRVLLKSFLANWKNYVVFFFSSMIMVSVLFTFFSVKNMLDMFDAAGVMLDATHGISQMVMNGTVILGVLSIFLMGFSMKYYVETRRRCYGVYKLLGISGVLLKRMIMLEYAGTIICSFIGGFLFGNVIYGVCKLIIKRKAFTEQPLANPHLLTYVTTFIVAMAILGVALAINREIAIETDMIQITTGGASEEKRPVKRAWLGVVIGVLFVVLGIATYSIMENGENIWTIMSFLGGVILLVRYGGSILLSKGKKQKKYYYRNLLAHQSFYYQFRTHTSYMIMLFLLQFIILFYYPVQILTNVPTEVRDEAYAYDFVWKMNRYEENDVQFFQELKEKYQAEIVEIPAVSITAAKRESGGPRYTPYVQGQHIGIPESAYEKLTGRKVELNKEEICVFLQQGKEQELHSLDYFGTGKEVYLHFGPAYLGVDMYRAKDHFTDRFVVKETRAEWVLGEYGNNLNEHIVVFADEIFEQFDAIENLEDLFLFQIQGIGSEFSEFFGIGGDRYSDAAGFLNRLVLIQAEGEDYQKIEAAFRENYNDEGKPLYDGEVRRYYVSEAEKEKVFAERIFRNIISIILLAVFAFAEVFIIALRLFSESGRLKEYDRFYQIMGMSEKKRKKAVFAATRMFILLPTVIAVISGFLFTMITLRLRNYEPAEMMQYMKMYLPMVFIFIVIQYLVYICMKLVMHSRMAVR